MDSLFWKLPEGDFVEIVAPASVLNLLVKGIALSDKPTPNASILKLEWDSFFYQRYYAVYWLASYQPDQVIRCENDEDWFLLGYGFILSYSKIESKASFYIEPKLVEDLLIYSYPLLNLLILLLKQRGYAPLHAAVIGYNDCFVLIPGKQNTGKSTTSVTWALHGGHFVTDDLCFVNVTDPFKVHGFYPTIRLRETSLPLISHLLPASWVSQRAASKYFFSVLSHLPQQFKPQATLNAIFCINVQNEKQSHTIVPAKMGFEYLVSSVAFSHQHNADGKICLQAIKKLTKELPVFKVNLSPKVDENYLYLKELMISIKS